MTAFMDSMISDPRIDKSPARNPSPDFLPQVFAKEDFAPLAVAMQDVMAAGSGCVVTVRLTTVENSWWGIPAGVKASVASVSPRTKVAWVLS